jgi:preprotein translocase subunit SecA
MSHLREGIHLRGYAQEDPLRAYTIEGFDMFDSMLQKIDKDVSIFLLKAEIRQNIERKEQPKKLITNDTEETPVKKKPKRVIKLVGMTLALAAQGRNTNNVVVSSRKYKGLRGFCPRKKWPKIAICPHFVHVNLKLWTTGHKML